VEVGELKGIKVAFENDSWSQMNIFQSSFRRSGEGKGSSSFIHANSGGSVPQYSSASAACPLNQGIRTSMLQLYLPILSYHSSLVILHISQVFVFLKPSLTQTFPILHAPLTRLDPQIASSPTSLTDPQALDLWTLDPRFRKDMDSPCSDWIENGLDSNTSLHH